MHLDVHRNGVKLFFITFAVVGRERVLSRLVDAKARPELLPLGEVVKAGLLAIHQVWPATGTSDFVIMPDHVHFLMVVDFLRVPKFNPLWATHRLLDAIEAGWYHRGQAPESLDMVAELKAAVARGREVAAALKRGEPQAEAGRGAVAQAGCARVSFAFCPMPCRRATTPRPKTVAKSPRGGYSFSRRSLKSRRFRRLRYGSINLPPTNFAPIAS